MFAHCFISEQVGVQKPDPRFFEPCFETLRADGLDMRPDETILIGDSLTSDVAGGKRYGVKTCWYRKKAAPVPEDGVPDYIVDRLAQVQELLYGIKLNERRRECLCEREMARGDVRAFSCLRRSGC